MEQALDRPPTEADPSAEDVGAFSPLQQHPFNPPQPMALNPPGQQVFFIDTEHFLAQEPALGNRQNPYGFPDDDALW